MPVSAPAAVPRRDSDPHRRVARHWSAWAFGSAAIGLTAWWIATTPALVLRERLRVSQFWILEILFVATVALSVDAFRKLKPVLLARDWAVMAVLAAAAAALVSIAPRTSRIYYDEQIYQAVGQNLSDLRLAQMCNDGTTEYGYLQCWRYEYNKQPYGYPYVLSVAYRLAGTSDVAAHRINAGMAAGTALAIFLILLLATGDRRAAAAGGLALLLIPEQLRWSHSAASEPSTALFCSVAVLAAVAFCRAPSVAALAWVAASSSFATHFRPEALLIVPIVFVAILGNRRKEILEPRYEWVFVAWLIMLIPGLIHLAAVRGESWGASGDRMSLGFAWANLVTNTSFYVADHRFPVGLTLLALAGVSRSRTALLLGMWFLSMWGVFLFFYAGSYNFGADVRYSLLSYAPLAAFAGLGASRVAHLAGTRGWPVGRAFAAVVVVLVVHFLSYLPWVRSVGEEAWAARADVRFARELASELPANSVVLTHNPGMFHLWGRSASQLSFAAVDPRYVREALVPRYAGGVYLHWNFWCNVSDEMQKDFCRRALAAYPSQLVRDFRERDYRYALYKLDVAPIH